MSYAAPGVWADGYGPGGEDAPELTGSGSMSSAPAVLLAAAALLISASAGMSSGAAAMSGAASLPVAGVSSMSTAPATTLAAATLRLQAAAAMASAPATTLAGATLRLQASAAMATEAAALQSSGGAPALVGESGMATAPATAQGASSLRLQASATMASSAATLASSAGQVADPWPIDWPETAATATVPRASLVAVVPAAQLSATVPRTNFTAIVPPTGADDMQPIATFEQYSQDREVYNINFAARYMPQGDTADRLLAIGHDPGITVTTQVAVGGLVPSGVVFFAVDNPEAVGTYKVWAQIRTTAGRERTGVVLVNVDAV
jgi:hypothetical protein